VARPLAEPDDAAQLAAQEAMQDALAVERVLRGDGEAYGELVGRHMRRAFSVAHRIVQQREDAEDVVQEAFMRALEHLDTLARGRPFRPWFTRIVVNTALNLRRSRAVRMTDPLPDHVAGRGAAPDQHAERSQLRDRLGAALESLPETQRTVVVLAELEEMTSAEIAVVLDLSPGTVRWHLHQARRTLRRSLGWLKEET
jgi:RNA polymerase sigma-70 factor, ECF subfamily